MSNAVARRRATERLTRPRELRPRVEVLAAGGVDARCAAFSESESIS